jgi:putative chitinase
MNYAAARLLEVFPTHFNHSQAIDLAHRPKLIADRAYDGPMGHCPGTDDGWNCRGQGLSQPTGREAHIQLSKITGLDPLGNPELLVSAEHAL